MSGSTPERDAISRIGERLDHQSTRMGEMFDRVLERIDRVEAKVDLKLGKMDADVTREFAEARRDVGEVRDRLVMVEEAAQKSAAASQAATTEAASVAAKTVPVNFWKTATGKLVAACAVLAGVSGGIGAISPILAFLERLWTLLRDVPK